MVERICNCRHTHVEGVKEHEPGCPMTQKAPEVQRDPYRLSTAQVLREICGGNEDGTEEHGGGVHDLHGMHATVGVDEPLTQRPGEYMGIDRTKVTGLGRLFLEPLREVAPPGDPTVDSLPAPQPAWYGNQAGPSWLVDGPYVLITPEEQRLIDDIKKSATAGELRKAIDRYMAGVYDSQIDSLAAKRREHTKRLIK